MGNSANKNKFEARGVRFTPTSKFHTKNSEYIERSEAPAFSTFRRLSIANKIIATKSKGRIIHDGNSGKYNKYLK